SSRRRHTRFSRDWSSDVCSSDLRTRTHENKDEELFTNFRDIFSPPSSIVRNYARCNKPFQPLFYCAENPETSFIELVDYWAKTRSEERRVGKECRGQWVGWP